MSYFRRGMGDGPITDPCQIDPSTCVVATVPPTRTECAALPADSPFRQPGQVCAPRDDAGNGNGSVMDWVMGLIKPAFAPQSAPTPADEGMSPATFLLLAAGAFATYRYFRKGKR